MHPRHLKNWITIELIVLIQLWICLPVTNSAEFCDAHKRMQRVACLPGRGCVFAIGSDSTWVQARSVCECHGMQFSHSSHDVQQAIDAAPKNLQEQLWISGSKFPVRPCGFVQGLTQAVQAVCDAFKSGVFLWMVQAFYTQGHRGAEAIPICRSPGCAPHNVGRCVFTGNTTTSWYDARNQCLEKGGDLFYLLQEDNDNFLEFLRTIVNVIMAVRQIGNPVYWAGIRYEDWYWQGAGDVKRTNWAPNEPSIVPKYDCVSMDMTTGKWRARSCGTQMGVLCRDFNVTYVAPPSTSTVITSSTTVATTISQATTDTNATSDAQSTAESGAMTTAEPGVTMTTTAETVTEDNRSGTGHVNASAVSQTFCQGNAVICGAVPVVVIIIVAALIIVGLFAFLRTRRKNKPQPANNYAIHLPPTIEGDNNFNGLRDGARANDNIYVDTLRHLKEDEGNLKEDEGIYHEIGKKSEDYDDDDYDDAGPIKKPPLDYDDFDSLKKPQYNHAFDDEDDLKKPPKY